MASDVSSKPISGKPLSDEQLRYRRLIVDYQSLTKFIKAGVPEPWRMVMLIQAKAIAQQGRSLERLKKER